MRKAIIKKPAIAETLGQLQECGDFVIFPKSKFNIESARTFCYSWARRNGIKIKLQVTNNSVTVTRV